MTYSYRIYGLVIESSARIAALDCSPHDFPAPNLSLSIGNEPEWVASATKLPGCVRKVLPSCEETGEPQFVLSEHGDEQYFELSYSDGARFVIDGPGTNAWGTFGTNLTSEDLAQYFLGPVMGFVLRRRQITCLHASSAILCGRAVAFCGEAGAGKSTLAASLALRGVPILSDDILPLTEKDEQFFALPGCPRVCLWPESVTELLGRPEALPKLVDSWEKRYLPLNGEHAVFANEKAPLGMIYLIAPRVTDTTAPRIEEIRPRDALLGLVGNTYMNWLLDKKARAAEFDKLWQLVSQVSVRRIVPHADTHTINSLSDLVLADAEANIPARSPNRFARSESSNPQL